MKRVLSAHSYNSITNSSIYQGNGHWTKDFVTLQPRYVRRSIVLNSLHALVLTTLAVLLSMCFSWYSNQILLRVSPYEISPLCGTALLMIYHTMCGTFNSTFQISFHFEYQYCMLIMYFSHIPQTTTCTPFTNHEDHICTRMLWLCTSHHVFFSRAQVGTT